MTINDIVNEVIEKIINGNDTRIKINFIEWRHLAIDYRNGVLEFIYRNTHKKSDRSSVMYCLNINNATKDSIYDAIRWVIGNTTLPEIYIREKLHK